MADPSRHEGLTGESALLAALNASRTGTMSDIVETIQAEQDHIIRSGLDGVLVVQGGPGTGKTAVALHRAAYLLYTYRRQLEKRGVLVVGPNATFLRYIGQVLPSLGETSVLLSTVGDLFPGVSAGRHRAAADRRDQGPARHGQGGGRRRARPPAGAPRARGDHRRSREAHAGPHGAISRARERARRSRRPHNLARAVFAREIITALTSQAAARLGRNVLGGPNLLGADEIDDLRGELRADPEVQAAIERLWPVLTPQQLLSDLFASKRRLATAAPGLSQAERDALLRDPAADQNTQWTPADVPLLDEAAELLGQDDRAIAGREGAPPPAARGLRPGRAGHHRPR